MLLDFYSACSLVEFEFFLLVGRLGKDHERLRVMGVTCCEREFVFKCLVKAVLLQCLSHIDRRLESGRLASFLSI